MEQASHRVGDRGGIARVEQDRVVTDDLRYGSGVRACDRNTAAHRLKQRDAEALIHGGEDEACGHLPQALELGTRQPARPAHIAGEPERLRMRAQLALMRRRVPREHEDRALVDQRQRVEETAQVLVRQLGREREQHAAVAQHEALAQLRLRQWRHRRRSTMALIDDVDLLRRRSERDDDVLLRCVRYGDDAVGAVDRERDEATHCERAEASVHRRHVAVDEVVHGHDADEATVQRRGRGERVQEVNAGARAAARGSSCCSPRTHWRADAG